VLSRGAVLSPLKARRANLQLGSGAEHDQVVTRAGPALLGAQWITSSCSSSCSSPSSVHVRSRTRHRSGLRSGSSAN
jgi:hypothetical protein